MSAARDGRKRTCHQQGGGYDEAVKKSYFWPVLLMVAVFALSRWPKLMPPNFSATYALLFCAGLYFRGWTGWLIPLVVVAATDVLLTFFFYAPADFALGRFLATQLPNYLAYAGLIGLGRLLGGKHPLWMLAGGGLIGALLFYVVTNTAAWLTLPYPKTFTGWLQAITTGLPGYPPTWEFFRNTLLSGGVFTGLFVSAMKLTEESEVQEKEAEPAEETEAEPASAGSAPAGQ